MTLYARCPCPFCKSRAQAKADVEKANERLRGLDADARAYIADKYYRGRAPWRREQ